MTEMTDAGEPTLVPAVFRERPGYYEELHPLPGWYDQTKILADCPKCDAIVREVNLHQHIRKVHSV
jgi:hypothetical protein